MTKPRNASYFRNPERPDPQKLRAPVERTEEKPNRALQTGARKPRPAGSRAPQRSATSVAPANAPRPPQPKSPAQNDFPGAMINRRAADRLREGYLWVYASDVESLKIGRASGRERV